MSEKQSDSVPAKMQPVYDEITALTDTVCREHLDDDYVQLARKMTAALARKRPSPLQRGRRDVWAAAIVYALASINFLFDKSQVPTMQAEDLCALFGVSRKTAANKARTVRDALNACQADPKWWRPSNMEDNPFAWWVSVNGLVVDARKLPLAVQEHLANEGIIPFVPSKKEAGQNKSTSEPASGDDENQEDQPRIYHLKIEPV